MSKRLGRGRGVVGIRRKGKDWEERGGRDDGSVVKERGRGVGEGEEKIGRKGEEGDRVK